MHLDAAAFGPNQAGLAQGFEMMRQGRLGDWLLADLQKIGAVKGAIGSGDISENRDPYRIGKGVEQPLDGDVFDGGMKQRSHTRKNIRAFDKLFNSSYYLNYSS